MEKSLPKGWVETELGDVLDIEMGQSPPSYSYNIEGIGTPFMQGKTEFGKTFPTIIKYTTEPKKIVEKGTVLLSVRAPIGPTNIANTQMCIGRGLAGLSSNKLPTNFILYYLRSIESVLDGLGTGTTFKAISGNKIYTVHFPLPPLPEQERIVAKLDKLFAQHEKIKKALDRIPQLLKAFRQQVLTQAVTGRLTEQWREGKDLEEWDKRLVKEISTKLGSGSTPRGGSAKYLSEGIPLVRSMNVVFGGLKLDGLAFISEAQAAALKNVEIHFEDILLNITGASIGRLCLADKSVTGGRVNQHVFIIRADKEIVYPKFLESYLRSNLVQSFIEAVKYGAGMEAISKTQIENLKINIPMLQEQQEIVRRVESLFAKADAIVERYQMLKAKIDSLPQAILHKAFKGELVPQLPTDGDAKDLLAEIMALKEEVKGRKRK